MGSSELPLLVHGEGKGLPQPVLAGGYHSFALLLNQATDYEEVFGLHCNIVLQSAVELWN